MNDEHIKAIALFFFFAFLDEKTAMEAAAKTALKFRRRAAKLNDGEATSALIVSLTSKHFASDRTRVFRQPVAMTSNSGILLPAKTDLSAWRQFQKEGSQNDFLAVIWSKILALPDHIIAAGLGVTVGTVRFRVGKGLRELGAMNRFKMLTKS